MRSHVVSLFFFTSAGAGACSGGDFCLAGGAPSAPRLPPSWRSRAAGHGICDVGSGSSATGGIMEVQDKTRLIAPRVSKNFPIWEHNNATRAYNMRLLEVWGMSTAINRAEPASHEGSQACSTAFRCSVFFPSNTVSMTSPQAGPFVLLNFSQWTS